MPTLILGLVIFLGMHSVQMLAPGWRNGMVKRIGLLPWKGVYALVSIIGFALIVYGFGLARTDPLLLYVPPSSYLPSTTGVQSLSARNLNALFTLAAFVLTAAAYVPRNHLKQKLGHPMLVGVMLWAVGHLLDTGFLHHHVLFGTFLVWAVADFAVSRRRDRETGTVYPAGTLAFDALAAVVGIAAWAIFAFLLHGPLIGVKPIL